MRRSHVSSSVIASLGYDRRGNVLEMEFQGGRIYQYFLVPRSKYEEIRRARSLGGFFNREIRTRYPCREVGPRSERATPVART